MVLLLPLCVYAQYIVYTHSRVYDVCGGGCSFIWLKGGGGQPNGKNEDEQLSRERGDETKWGGEHTERANKTKHHVMHYYWDHASSSMIRTTTC